MAQANMSDADLAQLNAVLESLLSAEKDKRTIAEAQLDTWLAQQPDFLLCGLSAFIVRSSEAQLRSHSCILLRRLAFKLDENVESEDCAWKRVQDSTRINVKEQLLQSLGNETDLQTRHKVSDTIAKVADYDFNHGDAWKELLESLSGCTQSPNPVHRESAFRIFATVPDLISNQPVDALKEIFMRGLIDADSQEVRFESMKAVTAYVKDHPDSQKELTVLMPNMFATLTPVIEKRDDNLLTDGLVELIELAEEAPRLFRQVLPNVLTAMTSIANDENYEDRTRQTALELLLTIAEFATPMARKTPDFISSIVPVALKMIADVEDDGEWYTTDDLDEDDNDENYVMGESTMDRLARIFGGAAVVPIAFQYIPQMLQHPDWQQRRASLMAISSIAEGSEKVMKPELGNIIKMVQPSFKDPHPRVRYAACNALGQLSTDFAPYLQKNFHKDVINDLLLVMADDTQPRVQAHAAAAMVNFCEEANKKVLDPYLDSIFEQLLVLLKSSKTYVQEQAITTIATVADSAEDKFIKYHGVIMPILVQILETATDTKYRLLRCRSIECASLIALAIGKDAFAPYTQNFIQILASIQQTGMGAEETGTEDVQSYLLAAWARMCKTMGSDFLPYLPEIMPPLLKSATLTPEFSYIPEGEDAETNYSSEEGWEFVGVNGQQIGIKTYMLEEKHTAMDMLVSYARDLGAGFKDYLAPVLEIALVSLKFIFHDGVRHAAASLIPLLLRDAKEANFGPGELMAMWTGIYDKLIKVLEKEEEDISFLAQLFTSFYECLEVLGENCLQPEQIQKFTTATEAHLNGFVKRLVEREKARTEEGYDAEDEEQLAEDEDSEEDLLSEIARAIQGVFKAHHAGFLPYFDEKILPLASQMISHPNVVTRQWAICVFDDVVEFTGPESFRYTQYFLQPMVGALQDQAPQVRQAAAYGIGICAQFGGQEYTESCRGALPILFEMISQNGSRSDESVYATENAVSAIAKICKFCDFAEKDAALSAWLGTLPITNDDQEAPLVYSYLLDLLEAQHPSILGTNNEGVGNVAKIFTEVLAADILPEEHTSRMVNDLRVVLSGLDQASRDQLWNEIPPESQAILQKKGYV